MSDRSRALVRHAGATCTRRIEGDLPGRQRREQPALAVPDAARVLREHGRLRLVWNIRDERVDWVAELGRLVHRGIEQDMRSDDPPVGPPFGPVERFDLTWSHRLTRQGLVDLVISRSYVITLPESARAQMLRAVTHLMDAHPPLVGHSHIDMPYLTRCTRTSLM